MRICVDQEPQPFSYGDEDEDEDEEGYGLDEISSDVEVPVGEFDISMGDDSDDEGCV